MTNFKSKAVKVKSIKEVNKEEKKMEIESKSNIVMRMGSNFRIFSDDTFDIYEKLPADVYKMKFDLMSGFYIETSSSYSDVMKLKLYGDHIQRSERILNTFDHREKSTGVLLSGEKGSGKTLLLKKIAMDAVERGYPVIVIDRSVITNDGFSDYVEKIKFPAVIIMDEFEKMIDMDEQENLLSLFDGLDTTKKLFILTVNKVYLVNDFFIARPGRIFYHYTYGNVDEKTIREYTADYDLPEDFVEDIVIYSNTAESFSFDSMVSVIEEHLRYGESFDQIVKVLNIAPMHTNKENYYDVFVSNLDNTKRVQVFEGAKIDLKDNCGLNINKEQVKKLPKWITEMVKVDYDGDINLGIYKSNRIGATKDGIIYRDRYNENTVIILKKNNAVNSFYQNYGIDY